MLRFHLVSMPFHPLPSSSLLNIGTRTIWLHREATGVDGDENSGFATCFTV